MRGRGYKRNHANGRSDFFLHSLREDVTMARKNVADLLAMYWRKQEFSEFYGVSRRLA